MAVNRSNFHLQALTTNDLVNRIRLTEYNDLCDIIQRFEVTGNDLLVLQEFELKIKFKNEVSKDKLERFQALLRHTRTTPEKLFPSSRSSFRKTSKPPLLSKPKRNSLLSHMVVNNNKKDTSKANYPIKPSEIAIGSNDNTKPMLDELCSKFAQKDAIEITEKSSKPEVPLKVKLDRIRSMRKKEEEPIVLNIEIVEHFNQRHKKIDKLEEQSNKPVFFKSEHKLSSHLPNLEISPQFISTCDVDYINIQQDKEQYCSEQTNDKIEDLEQQDYDIPVSHLHRDNNTQPAPIIENTLESDTAKEKENSKQNYIQLQNDEIYSEVAEDEENFETSASSVCNQSCNDDEVNQSIDNMEIPPPLPARPKHITFNMNKVKNIKQETKQISRRRYIEPEPVLEVVSTSSITEYGILPDVEIKPPSLAEDDNIYEEPITLMSPKYLLQQHKFYRNISRLQGMDLLQNRSRGSYLFRSSTKFNYLAVLMIKGAVKTQNVPVSYHYEEQGFYLETQLNLSETRKTFAELEELLDYYTRHDINGELLLDIESNDIL